MTSPSEPRWFVLAMASRWPAAIVLAAWAVAVAAIQILKQPLPVALPQQTPFPVRLVGGVTVKRSSTGGASLRLRALTCERGGER